MHQASRDISNVRTKRGPTLSRLALVLSVWAATALSIPAAHAVTQSNDAAEPQGEPGTLRWDIDEKPYADQSIPRRIGSNLRDGTITVADSFFQGLSTGFTLFFVRGGGTLGQKVGTIAGDVVGLVDANPATRYVFRGVASRQLLRYGALAQPSRSQLGSIYDTEFDRIQQTELTDYVGDEWFHTRAYKTPSVVFGVGGTALSSIVVRPVGGVLTLFGLRGTGEKVDAAGVDLVERSLAVPFL